MWPATAWTKIVSSTGRAQVWVLPARGFVERAVAEHLQTGHRASGAFAEPSDHVEDGRLPVAERT